MINFDYLNALTVRYGTVTGVIIAILPLLLIILTFVASKILHRPRKPAPSELYFQILQQPNNQLKQVPIRNLNNLAEQTGSEEKVTHTTLRNRKPEKTKEKVYLSVVIPAYNESKRLPEMLQQCYDHLLTNQHRQLYPSFEVIVVDDGSRDDTARVALHFTSNYCKDRKMKISARIPPVKVIQLVKNRGKGGAVTQGMLAASGEYMLMVDADGATDFACLDDLFGAAASTTTSDDTSSCFISIGSRAHLVRTEQVVKRSMIRNMLMYAFHAVVFILSSAGVRRIKDTQCGFKLFSRSACQLIFPRMHVEGWIFDIEMLHLAWLNSIEVYEVPVRWTEIDGSKMSLVRDSIKM